MIAIIGRGNVASHLYTAIKPLKDVCLVNPHSFEGLPESPELILISVSDDAISKVVNNLPLKQFPIAHTSGSVSMDVLRGKSKNYGVFYPLQTFTKGIAMDYKDIPIFLEASNETMMIKLKEIASVFSNHILEADSEARKKLHLASVYACNFVNALAGIATELLKDSKIDQSVLIPLMEQTVRKLQLVSPQLAQTGPAVREDYKVIKSHLDMLENKPACRDVYSILTELIINSKQV